MKYISFLKLSITFILIFFSSFVFANENVINGSVNLNKVKFESLTINGNLNFKDLVIEKNISINGSANGNNLKCKEININGSLNGKYIDISGKTNISGGLSVSDGNFGDIEIASDEINLTNSKAKNIFVKETRSKTQLLKLKKKTIISGDVIFESGIGEIILTDGSEIHGNIKGAVVVNK
jgi:hypothetical protein